MHSASDRVEQAAWLDRIEAATATLDLPDEARANAVDLFLDAVPEDDRSKPAVAAASLYAGALLAGAERSQGAVADAMDVSRPSVQNRWKGLLREAGFDVPDW